MFKKKVKVVFLINILILFISLTFQTNSVNGTIEPFFTLVAKTNENSIRGDYLWLAKEQLARIGIQVDIILVWSYFFLAEIIAYRDFDMVYLGFSGGGADPDFTGVYDENGSLNLFGYHTSMDWNETLGTGTNEWYMKLGNLIMPPDNEERIQHYWAWEQYMMDKILPCLPSITTQNYICNWNNLIGFNSSKGLFQSWGKMFWNGMHPGQESTDEIVIVDSAWSDLNPIFQDDKSSYLISQAIMDPLIWYDHDLTVWPHLAESYEMINDTYVRIKCREGIKWQLDPDGLFPDEYFDAHDVFFTLYAWKHLSNDQHLFDWLEDMIIVDDFTLDIYIDGDPDTLINDPYAQFLPMICRFILPEHYLNQTQLADGITPDIIHPNWNSYATNAFGTGLFELSEFIEGDETSLSVYPNCWRLNESITNDPILNWEQRFGTFDSCPSSLKIKIINDFNTEITYFDNGWVDIIDLSADYYTLKNYESNINIESQNNLNYELQFFGFNMRPVRPVIGNPEPCADDPTITKGLAVRKAIAYAINREEINAVMHGGECTINHWPIYEAMGIWCNPNIIRYDFNLTKAKEYLVLAGYEYPSSNYNGNTISSRFSLLLTIELISLLLIFAIIFISIFSLVSKKNIRKNSERK